MGFSIGALDRFGLQINSMAHPMKKCCPENGECVNLDFNARLNYCINSTMPQCLPPPGKGFGVPWCGIKYDGPDGPVRTGPTPVCCEGFDCIPFEIGKKKKEGFYFCWHNLTAKPSFNY